MRKLLVFLVMIGLLLGAAQAEEMVTVDVNVTEGALEGLSIRSGKDAGLDAMCLRDYDGDGKIQQWELDERIDCQWYSEDDSLAIEPAYGFMQWYEEDRTGFEYPAAHFTVPASADGKRIWCELTDRITGERCIIQYVLHLDGIIARKPDISPEAVHLGANSWELQVEEGTQVTIQLKDGLRDTVNDELSYHWYKTKFETSSGWAESASFENDGDSLTFTATMEDHGWSYEWYLSNQSNGAAAHAGHVLMYVYPKGGKPDFEPITASGTIPYESGMVLYSVYHELTENHDLPYSVRSEWLDRLIHNQSEGLVFQWMSEDPSLQKMLENQRGVGQHLVFELAENEAQRLIEKKIACQCTIIDEENEEKLAVLTYTFVRN